jgi:Flp pilus assembly protein TadG/uncharacterized protein YegL
MKKMTEERSMLARLRDDRRGNFAMMTAFALPVILGAGGFAMDLTNMVLTKAELQDAVDSASLAAASALSNDKKTVAEAKTIALKFFKTQLSGTLPGQSDLTSATTIDITETTEASGGKTFKINIATGYELQLNPLTRLFGPTSKQIAASGSAESGTESKNALSMYLVLDKSGSMLANTNEIASYGSCTQYNDSGSSIGKQSPCYVKKIEALQTAATTLFNQLNKADPNTKYVRTGTVSYYSKMDTAYSLAWGTTAAQKQVNALSAGGGTSSTDAMNAAYTKLSDATENSEHAKKNGQTPTKYIILMTDGNNNNTSDDTATQKICDKAKKDKMEVYGVAFMAPSRGQKLLQSCVSAPENYFAAEKMSDLVSAFKAIGERAAQVIARITK